MLKAEKVFRKLNITNIVTKYADGNLGWKEQIPFDRIIITAATSNITKEKSFKMSALVGHALYFKAWSDLHGDMKTPTWKKEDLVQYFKGAWKHLNKQNSDTELK